MNRLDRDIQTALVELVPPRPGRHLSWDEVLRRAADAPAAVAPPESRRRRRRATAHLPLRRVVLAVGLVAVICAAVLAWPFASDNPTVLERARAAIGDGPVLHVVVAEDWGTTAALVDLDTGAREELPSQRELWYDPSRGLREVSSLGGVALSDYFYPPAKVPRYRDKTLALLASGYRDSLESGRARLLGPGQVDGVAVYWIRVDAVMLPDVADGKVHEWAHDVAVARDSYEPVATRETRDGKVAGVQMRILRLDTLPAGAGEFAAQPVAMDGTAYTYGARGAIDLAAAARVFGQRPVWAGREVAGLPLVGVASFVLGKRPKGAAEWERMTGLTFSYGHGGPSESDAAGPPPPPTAKASPFIHIRVIPHPHPHLDFTGYIPPPGKALVGLGSALLQSHGLFVSVQARTERLALAGARALEPMPTVP